MDELISKRAAIKALERTKEKDPKDDIDRFYNTIIDRKIAVIEALPSAERKKGRWVSTDDGWDGEYFVCSECGCPWTLIEGSPEDNGMNFCPNCGAEMMNSDEL